MEKLKKLKLIKQNKISILKRIKASWFIFVDNFIIGFQSVIGNKSRTFLSMLGIIIGIASVIAVTSLGQSATYGIKSQIESIGTSNIMLFAKPKNSKTRLLYKKYFTFDLKNTIKENIPGISNIIINLSKNVYAKYKNNSDSFTLKATDSSWAEINNYYAIKGRFLTKDDDNKMNVVIGSEVASTLFGKEDPINKKISVYVNHKIFTFKVIGVMESKTRSLISYFDQDIYIPIQTYKHKIQNIKNVNQLILLIDNPEDSELVTESLDILLKKIAHLPNDETDLYYVIISQAELLATYNEVTKTLNLFLGGIAAISLIVGGIGIMNIMLVSVTERTKEIGIRKAIGAKKSYIFSQFLIESSLISGIGGIIGLFFGIGITYILDKIFKWEYVINIQALLIAIIFSLFIGTFFGFYPAKKAAELNPVEALMYE